MQGAKAKRRIARKKKGRAFTDNLCKYLAERYPELYAAVFLGHPVKRAKVLKTELMSPPIQADSVILLDTGDEIVHIEFQTNPQSEPPIEFRMLDYWVRLYRKYRQAAQQFVILLKETTIDVPSEFAHGGTRHTFNIVKMWEQNPQAFMTHEAILPLATLCRAESKAGLLEEVADKVAEVKPLELKRNVSNWVQLIAGLRFEEELIRMLFKEGLMRESSVYRALVREISEELVPKAKLEGERGLIMKQLTRQIGKLSAQAKRRIASLSRPQIEALGEALLKFKKPEDLTAWLDKNATAH